MTKRELIRAEINLKSRWSQAIYQQQLAKEKPERKEIAEEAANVALGYMYAIADILQVTKGVSNADSIVRAWAESVEESDPGTAKAIQVQASKVALTYFIALTRNWMDEVESDLNSRRR